MGIGRTGAEPALSQQLLLGIAEQLKLPLLQIARRAELAQLHAEPDLPFIQATAEAALRLVDSYVLSVQLAEQGQQSLMLEPVSVSSVLYDAGQQLSALAKFYGVELELNVAGRFGPVLANKQGLQAALTSLGLSLIESLPALGSRQLKLELATHRCRYGIVAGVYCDSEMVTLDALRQGRKLVGKSRQPLVQGSHAGGAGIFVADALLHAMRLKLQASRHHRLYGLGTVLQPNNQLQLV